MAYNAKKVFIFHFTHVDNFPAILNEGLWADASIDCDKYKNIGNVEIKSRRKTMSVPFGGYVANYVPFYFAPRSPMMYTQFKNDIIKNDETIYLVANAHDLIPKYKWCCSNMNEAKNDTSFFETVEDLEKELSWEIFSTQYWNNTDAYPDRMERRMAEFLVYERVAWDDFLGVAVYNEAAKVKVYDMMCESQRKDVIVKNDWYF